MLKNLRNIFRKKTDYNSLPHIDCQEDAYAILYNMPLKQDKTFMTFTSTNTYEELKKMQMMDESLEADGSDLIEAVYESNNEYACDDDFDLFGDRMPSDLVNVDKYYDVDRYYDVGIQTSVAEYSNIFNLDELY